MRKPLALSLFGLAVLSFCAGCSAVLSQSVSEPSNADEKKPADDKLLNFSQSASATKTDSSSDRSVVTGTSAQTGKNYDLDIGVKSITKENYSAAVKVGLPNNREGGLNLDAGTELSAEQMKMTLKNVKGNVYFRGTFKKVSDILRSHRREKGNASDSSTQK